MLGSSAQATPMAIPWTAKDPEQNGDTKTVPKESTMGSVKHELAAHRIQEESLLS